MRQLKTFLIFSILNLIGCQDDIDKKNKPVWFGGEIINPKSDQVLLYLKGFQDTLKLTENHFLVSYDSLPPNIYRFRHGPEVQWVFLEPGDSVILRLNTMEFDESLTFSGIGSDKNNFLIDYFLEREKHSFNPSYLTTLYENEFIEFYDSCYSARNKILNDFLNSNEEVSEYSKKILSAFVKFPFYTTKEFYPYNFTYSHKLDTFYKPHSPNFYDHREKVDLNDKDMQDLDPFFQYVQYYLYNATLEIIHKDSKELNDMIYEYAKERLNLITDKISNEKLRDTLILEGIHYFHYRNKPNSIELMERLLNMYKENITSHRVLKVVNENIALYKSSRPGQKLESFPVYNLNNQKIDLASFKEQLQIIFWRFSPLKYLPQIDFEAIKAEFDIPQFRTIFVLMDLEYKNLPEQFKSRFTKEDHYFFKQSDSIGLKLYLHKPPEIYLLDKDLVFLPLKNKDNKKYKLERRMNIKQR